MMDDGLREKILKHVLIDLGLVDNEVAFSIVSILLERIWQHFCLIYGDVVIDEGFGFLFEECLIKRYNRRGAEGAKSESLDGHSVTYEELADEFAPYDRFIKERLGIEKKQATAGGVFVL